MTLHCHVISKHRAEGHHKLINNQIFALSPDELSFVERKHAQETAKLIIKMINNVIDRVQIFLTYICRHFSHRLFVMILTEIKSLHKITFSFVIDPLTQSLSRRPSNMKATTLFIVSNNQSEHKKMLGHM